MRARPLVQRLIALGLLVLLAFAFGPAASHSEARSLSDDPALLLPTVSAGELHTCAVRTDGALGCWGFNSEGQATPPAGAGVCLVARGVVNMPGASVIPRQR